jgi:hypothetical protein
MKRIIIGIVAGLVLGATTVAVASIPSADGTFTACVKSDGALRLVDAEAGKTCKTSEQTVTWNQAGPQGPAGGVSGYEIVETSDTAPSGVVEFALSVNCPSGKKALGGGGTAEPDGGVGELVLDRSIPLSGGSGWQIRVRQLDGTGASGFHPVSVFAVCAVVAD